MKLTTAFFKGIKELILSARMTISRGVDLVQVYTNFEIGKRIVDQEQKGKGRAKYGQEVIKALAERLTAEFGKGFSITNLKSMRQFYLQNRHRITPPQFDHFDKSGKSQSLTGQLAETNDTQSFFRKVPASETGQYPTETSLSRQFCLSWTH